MIRVLAAVLVLGLALAACGGGDSDGFSDEIRDQFMSGCVPGVGEEFCDCALDELEKVYTEDEFMQVGLEAFTSDSDDVPDEVMAAVLACVDKIPSG
ncbi:MAG: hypothetical protein KQH83_06580 [Actinobacteria bacterium]|nr:hypothetical protein [Actinomycetota bacterium]